MTKFRDLKTSFRDFDWSLMDAADAIEELENVVRELYEWIDADEGFATDFPEEWERLTNMAKGVLGETK